MTEARFHTVWIPLQERFYRVAYYLLEDRADALDAVQDLYVKLWKMRDSLDLVRNPGAYGALLVRNLCIDRIRRLTPAEGLPTTSRARNRPTKRSRRRKRRTDRPLTPQHPRPGKPGPQKTETV